MYVEQIRHACYFFDVKNLIEIKITGTFPLNLEETLKKFNTLILLVAPTYPTKLFIGGNQQWKNPPPSEIINLHSNLITVDIHSHKPLRPISGGTQQTGKPTSVVAILYHLSTSLHFYTQLNTRDWVTCRQN